MRSLPKTEEEFLGQYWLKEELVEAAKSLGLPSSGSKGDITDSIAARVFRGRSEVKRSEPRLRTPKNKILDTDAKIVSPYANDEEHREFFLRTIGPHFKFNAQFMNWMKENQGDKTYRDAIDEWRRIAEEKSSGKKREIGSQFEYNQYTRDFFRHNPNRSREECIQCWNFKKSLLGSHKYGQSDLMVLDKKT